MKADGRDRDLALFNLAIDSKLRGCDLVALRVDDVAPHGRAADRATVRQTKTGAIPVLTTCSATMPRPRIAAPVRCKAGAALARCRAAFYAMSTRTLVTSRAER